VSTNRIITTSACLSLKRFPYGNPLNCELKLKQERISNGVGYQLGDETGPCVWTGSTMTGVAVGRVEVVAAGFSDEAGLVVGFGVAGGT